MWRGRTPATRRRRPEDPSATIRVRAALPLLAPLRGSVLRMAPLRRWRSLPAVHVAVTPAGHRPSAHADSHLCGVGGWHRTRDWARPTHRRGKLSAVETADLRAAMGSFAVRALTLMQLARHRVATTRIHDAWGCNGAGRGRTCALFCKRDVSISPDRPAPLAVGDANGSVSLGLSWGCGCGGCVE